MASPKAFTAYIENETKLNKLSDEQAGRLFKALFAYSRTNEAPDLSDDPLLDYAFTDFAMDVDRDREKYEETCKRRAEAGRKGGKSRKENDFDAEQTVSNCFSDEANQANAFSGKAKEANAFFAKQNEAKQSKSNKTKAKAKAKANINTNVFINNGAPDFDERANEVCRLFAKLCPDNVQPLGLTDHRRRLIYQAESDGVDFAYLFTKVNESDFLTGKSERGGAFGIDWVLDPKNRQKIIEGNYDNRGQPKGSVYDVNSASFDVSKFENSSMFD